MANSPPALNQMEQLVVGSVPSASQVAAGPPPPPPVEEQPSAQATPEQRAQIAGLAQLSLHQGQTVAPAVAAQAANLGLSPGVLQAGYQPPVPMHPVTQAYLSAAPYYAQVSHEDIPQLNNIAQTATAAAADQDARQALIAHHTFPEWSRALGYSTEQGIGNLLGMVTSAAPAAVNTLEAMPFVGKRQSLDELYDWTDNHMNGWAKKLSAQGSDDPEYLKREAETTAQIIKLDPKQGSVRAMEVIMQNFPTILAALGATAANPLIGGAAVLGGMEAQGTEQARTEGLSPRMAMGNATMKTGVMGALMLSPFGPFVKTLGESMGMTAAEGLVEEAVHGALYRTTQGIAQEAMHGAAFGAANDLIDKMTKARPDVDFLGDVAGNAASWAMLSPFVGLFHSQAPAVQEAMDNRAMLEKLRDSAQGNKTHANDPVAFRRFMDAALAKRNAQFQAVPLDAFNHIASTAGMTPWEFAGQHGVLDSYTQAQRESGSHVMVPTSNVIMADDKSFQGFADNAARAQGGLTPTEARTVGTAASKIAPTTWDEFKAGHWLNFAKSIMGVGDAKSPVIKEATVKSLDAALAAPDSEELGPKMMGHVMEGLGGEGLDKTLRERYGVGKQSTPEEYEASRRLAAANGTENKAVPPGPGNSGKTSWSPEQLHQLSDDFRKWISTPGSPADKDFSNLADTLEYTYRMHRLAGKETRNSTFDRMIAGRMIAKASALDAGRDAWMRKTGNAKYDEAIEEAHRSVQASVIGRELGKMNAENKAKVSAYAAEIEKSFTNTRWHQARTALEAGMNKSDASALAGYANNAEMDADLRANPSARKQAIALAKQFVDKEHTDFNYQELGYHDPDALADHLIGVYNSIPAEKATRMAADELMKMNPGIAGKLKEALGQRVDKLYRKGVAGLGLSGKPTGEIASQINDDLRDRKLGEFSPGQYIADQAAARRDAAKAWSRSKKPSDTFAEEAVLHKGEELYNMEAHRQAVQLKGTIDRATKVLKAFSTEKVLKGLSPRFSEQIRRTLADFGKQKHEWQKAQLSPLRHFIEHGLEAGDSAGIPLLPSLSAKLEGHAPTHEPLNLRDLTVREYLSLGSTVQMLGKMGQVEAKNAKVTRLSEIDDMAAETTLMPKKNALMPLSRLVNNLSPDAQHFVASTQEPSEMARMLDHGNPDGPFTRMFDRFRTALQNSYNKGALARKQFVDAMKDVDFESRYELPVELHGLDRANHALTGGQFLGLLLTRGDAEAFRHVTQGYGVKPEDVDKWIGQHATGQHWEAIKKTANALEWVGQEHQQFLRKNYLPEMKLVQHVPFKIGEHTMPGWYSPIRYDPSLIHWLNTAEEARPSFVDYTRNLKTGHEITRVQDFSKPFLLDIAKLPSVFHSVINDTEVRLAAHDMDRFLSNPDVQDHVRSVLSDAHNGALKDSWQQAVGAPKMQSNVEKVFTNALGFTRHAYTIAHMGGRIGINALHMLGFVQSIPTEIGPQYAAKGLSQFIGNTSQAIHFMNEVSPHMKMLFSGPTDEDTMNNLEDLRRHLGGSFLANAKNTRANFESFAMNFYSLVNRLGGAVSFLGEYQKHMDQGVDHLTAVKRAEDAVRRVVGPSNRFDMGSALGTHNEFFKNILIYSSYWNHLSNRLTAFTKDVFMRKTVGSQRTRVAAISGMLAYAVVPQLMHYLFEGNSLGPQSLGPENGNFWAWQAADLGAHWAGPFATKAVSALADFRGDTWNPKGGVASLVGPASDYFTTAQAAKDVYNWFDGNNSPVEDAQFRDKLFGDIAGGPASVLGIPWSVQTANIAKFVDSLNSSWGTGDWGTSTANPVHKALTGITTGRIPQPKGADQ